MGRLLILRNGHLALRRTEPEALPRLQVIAEQLVPGQTLDAAGLDPYGIREARMALAEQLGPEFDVSELQTGAERVSLRVTRRLIDTLPIAIRIGE